MLFGKGWIKAVSQFVRALPFAAAIHKKQDAGRSKAPGSRVRQDNDQCSSGSAMVWKWGSRLGKGRQWDGVDDGWWMVGIHGMGWEWWISCLVRNE